MPKGFFSASKQFFTGRTIKPRFETWSCDVFGCFAGLISEDFIYSQRNLIKSFAHDWGKDFCSWGKMIGTLGEYRGFASSSPKNSDCWASLRWKFWGNGSGVCTIT